MSADESRAVEPGRERWERSQQSAQWREIGIPAVAAAARYAGDRKPAAAAAESDAKAEPAKVVTLRDIEYFAA